MRIEVRKHSSLQADVFFNPSYVYSMSHKIYIFQSPGFLRDRFFRVQAFQGPGSGFSWVRVQSPGPGFGNSREKHIKIFLYTKIILYKIFRSQTFSIFNCPKVFSKLPDVLPHFKNYFVLPKMIFS